MYDLDLAEYLAVFDDRSQVTDSSGGVLFAMPVFVLRGGIWVWLWIDRLELEDTISGNTFYFRIRAEESEIIAVQMVPGGTAEGEHFAVTIDTISPPVPQ